MKQLVILGLLALCGNVALAQALLRDESLDEQTIRRVTGLQDSVNQEPQRTARAP